MIVLLTNTDIAMKRRDFIKTSAIIAPMMSVFPADLSSVTGNLFPGRSKRDLWDDR